MVRRFLALGTPTAALLLAGCTAVIFDESVSGLEIVRDIDDVFTISLPRAVSKSGFDRPIPEIEGNAVRLLERGRDDLGKRDLFKFSAAAVGEAKIQWWKIEGEDLWWVRDYNLKVRVRLAEW
jgi:hypothetical protein